MPTHQKCDLQFYYETAGDPNAPPLLIIVGISDYTAKASWQVSDLASDFFVITFDNRGAGQSTTPAPGYTIEDMADDAAAILDALGIESAHIFGFSMGGMIALNLAIRHPSRVRRLILGCTTAGGRLMIQPDEQVVHSLTNPIKSDDRRQDCYDNLWMSVSRGCANEQPALVEQLADLMIDNPQTTVGYAGQFQAVLGHDVVDRLPDIRTPTLIMHGQDDVMIPLENGRLLAQHISGAALIAYPDAGHLFFIERADVVNRDIRQFLSAPQ